MPAGLIKLVVVLAGGVILAAQEGFAQTVADPDCPCIDTTSVLTTWALSTSDHSQAACEDEEILFSKGGLGSATFCYPRAYGSSSCLAHDEGLHGHGCGEHQHEFCSRPWCYVDPDKCKESIHNYYRSDMLSAEHASTQALMYSYTTCGSDADAWHASRATAVLEDMIVVGTVPMVQFPYHQKYKPDGSLADASGAMYNNDTLPWDGAMKEYLDTIAELANIREFKFTHRSGGSSALIPGSSYTASVHDVFAGVSDMAIGGFWITGQRLEMVPFTTPMLVEQMMLWIPKPAIDNSLAFKSKMVLEPFTPQLWGCLFLCTFIHGILSIVARSEDAFWGLLTGKKEETWDEWSYLKRLVHICTVIADEWLASMTEFCSGGVFEGAKVSLPLIVLNVGWAVLILLSVAAYTSSLTAFLTLNVMEPYISSMEMAIEANTRICAQNALRGELISWHPEATYVFKANVFEVMEAFHNDECDAIANGVKQITDAQTYMCDNGLVESGIVMGTIPVAFPASPRLVAGLSYWIQIAAKSGIIYEEILARRAPPLQKSDGSICSIKLDIKPSSGPSSFDLYEMAFGFLLFGLAAALSVCLRWGRDEDMEDHIDPLLNPLTRARMQQGMVEDLALIKKHLGIREAELTAEDTENKLWKTTVVANPIQND